MSLAGNLPVDLGRVDLAPSEMMFWMYLPISVPSDHNYRLPANLRQFAEIVTAVKESDPSGFFLRHAYLTAKTLWVEGGYIGNRPGWHIDGYGTNDVNYIWSDRAPTNFLDMPGGIDLSDDCDVSMQEMHTYALRPAMYGGAIVTYPDKHLLRLDNTVVHRSPKEFSPGFRTFVKVSLSHDQYNLKGNSVNHLLPETHWPLVDRQAVRNHPATKESDHA